MPKITLKIGAKVLRPSIRKLKKILRDTSFRKKLEMDVRLRVEYGKFDSEIVENEIVTKDIKDLLWASEAFLDEDLYIKGVY